MASDTALAESAQAFFCAVADYVGTAAVDQMDLFNISSVNGRPTYCDFKAYWDSKRPRMPLEKIYKSKQVTVMESGAPVKFEEIEALLSPNTAKAKGWYKSSMNIAHKLLLKIKEIDEDFGKIQNSGFSTILYRRGTPEVMGTIDKLFKIAKKNNAKSPHKGITFGDVNKWSPADIYLASNVAMKGELSLTAIYNANKDNPDFDFNMLNGYISGLIDSGDLLPLSLKKQTNPIGVVLEKVNFQDKASRRAQRALIKKLTIRCTQPAGQGANHGWTVYKGTTKFTKGGLPFAFRQDGKDRQDGATGERRDVFLHIDAKTSIQFRHEATNPGTLKVEIKYKGGGGRGGSVGSLKSFAEVLKRVGNGNRPLGENGAKFASDLTTAYNRGLVKYHKIVQSKTMIDRYNEGKAKPNMPGKTMSAETEAYLRQSGDASGRTMANEIMPMILQWIHAGTTPTPRGVAANVDDSRTKRFIEVMYKHITSRTEISGQFVIAK